MPYKRKTTKRFRRKPRRRNYRVVRQPQVIADSQVVTLRYCDAISLDAGIDTRAYDTWSATSIYDPYVGVGGHQPLGSDEWSQFYNHYMVLGAKITAHFDVYSDAAGDSMIAVAKLSDTSTWTPTDVNTLIEQNKSNYRFLTSRPGSRNQGTVKAYYSPRKFFNLKNPRDEHDLRGVTGDAGSSPTENAYFHIGVAGMNPADNPTAVNVRVIVEYRVLYTERKNIAAS